MFWRFKGGIKLVLVKNAAKINLICDLCVNATFLDHIHQKIRKINFIIYSIKTNIHVVYGCPLKQYGTCLFIQIFTPFRQLSIKKWYT